MQAEFEAFQAALAVSLREAAEAVERLAEAIRAMCSALGPNGPRCLLPDPHLPHVFNDDGGHYCVGRTTPGGTP